MDNFIDYQYQIHPRSILNSHRLAFFFNKLKQRCLTQRATYMKESNHMTKQILRLVMVAMCLYASVAQAQLADPPIYIETIVHNGDYGEANHDLTGYVTYKVYVQFANSDCYLTNIFAVENPADCVQDAENGIFFNFDCGVFQHELGDAFGFNQLCLYDLFPTSEFDSYLTIGQTCNSNGGCDNLGYIGACIDWLDNFEQLATPDYFDGGSFFWDENSLFGASCFQQYPQSPTNADENSRVLIGQFTTCGNMDACINIQYRDADGVPGIQENDVCFSASNPCVDNPFSTEDLTISNPCFTNELGTLELNSGGNETVTYTLYTTEDLEVNSYTSSNGILQIIDLPEGDFYIAMEDEAGCQAVTSDFNVTFPEPFLFEAFVLSDELCFGALGGSIELQCSGGTGTVTIVDANDVEYDCGYILDGITCGTYDFTAFDQNNCVVESNASISCPAELNFTPTAINIDCFGDDDGVIFGTVTGGTGELTSIWELNGDQLGELSGISPFPLSIDSLDQGIYSILISDANNCSLTEGAVITEPDEITYTIEITDASCFGFCDGELITTAAGGTPPFEISTINLDEDNTPINALCAGDYEMIIEDNEGCIVTDSISVGEPTEITFSIDTTAVTCFSFCDGSIELTDVDGSAGEFSYEIDTEIANCAPCNGSQVVFTDLCSGQYTITIASQDGCSKTASAFVDTPESIEFSFTTQNVSCNGLSDALVIITEIEGGTEPFDTTLYFASNPTDSLGGLDNLSADDYIITLTDSLGCFSSDTFTITQPDSLKLSIDTALSCSCGNVCDGVIRFTPTGGTPNYQYLLTPGNVFGPAFGVVNGLCADDYELFLIDANGCRDSALVTISKPTPLEIVIDTIRPKCTGTIDGSVTLNPTGGNGELTLSVTPDTYEFTPDTIDIADSSYTAYTFNPIGEDTLYLELSDANGCRILDTLEIIPIEITDMILTMSSTPETCWNERNGTATVAVQNGNPPYSFSWDDNDNQQSATAMGLPPNSDYTVTVTDAHGCLLSESVFVEGNMECFFISTGITPNGDGVNDTWVLGGFEYYPECKVNVFNRWGQLMFTSIGYTSPWDGRYNGEPLPVADYYFTIDYSEEKDVIMGTVTLKY